MSQAGKLIETMRNQAQKVQSSPVQIGQITTINPLSIQYQGLDLSYASGDTIYINNLLLDENIELDVASMDSAQNFSNSTAYQSPSFMAEVSGTQKQFLTDLYNWIKAVHDRFILHVDDYVAVQKLGNNTYLILQKIQKVENEQ